MVWRACKEAGPAKTESAADWNQLLTQRAASAIVR